MVWMVQGLNPGGGKIFHTHPGRPQSTPSLLYDGCHFSFPGVKQPGYDIDHPPLLAPRLKKE